MRILAIETSCDETALALIKGEGVSIQIEKNRIASQMQEHAKYGGVVPEVAAREHAAALFPLLHGCDLPRDGSGIDVIAVTAGPGLVAALRVGVEAAKTLAWLWKKPLVAVNHLEGHIYSAFLSEENVLPLFPALCLLVSGGHTELILMKDHGVYELVGMTRDDAAGEAFDKVAKMLGLGYPGGPAIGRLAEQGNPHAMAFPRPMLEQDNFDFSFSGLKTAVLVYLKEHSIENEKHLADICASVQEAIVETLVTKTLRAAEALQPASVLVSGGVSANKRLREDLAARLPSLSCVPQLFLAPIAYTTDNAVMIGIAGYFRAMRHDFTDPLTLVADPNLRLAL